MVLSSRRGRIGGVLLRESWAVWRLGRTSQMRIQATNLLARTTQDVARIAGKITQMCTCSPSLTTPATRISVSFEAVRSSISVSFWCRPQNRDRPFAVSSAPKNGRKIQPSSVCNYTCQLWHRIILWDIVLFSRNWTLTGIKMTTLKGEHCGLNRIYREEIL